MSYWDTSCLIKLYTPERDSAAFHAHLASGGKCVTCDIAPLEFWATVRRKESEGMLAPGEAQKVQTTLKSDIASGVIEMTICDAAVRAKFHSFVDQCHAAQPPIFIRTNDALHLAAASVVGETEVVTTDKRLREAALALGLKIFPPAAQVLTP
jgi:predicted nucleic acid-binding protein